MATGRSIASRDRRSETKDEAIIREAKDRFKIARDWESNFRNLYVQDVKFALGDSDNGWQWPSDIWQARTNQINKRPAMTINKVGPLCEQITNDARKNKTSISIKPSNNAADFDAAQIFEGLVRHIEYESGAQLIYNEAVESQVMGGVAYWRVLTRYADDESFDQVIEIAPVRDHMGCLLDPFIKKRDASDAEWGFVFDEEPRDEFERRHPDVPIAETGLDDDGTDGWITEDAVRTAEYYRIVKKQDELIYADDGQGTVSIFKRSEAPKDSRWTKALRAAEDADKKGGAEGATFKRRKIEVKSLEWCKIAGGKIIDRRELKGTHVPIVRLIGRERVVEGKLQRSGHVRRLKDPQRMYNYNSSGQVEFGALATKSPWVGPAAAFAGNEPAWNSANVTNAAYLTYKHFDYENNQQIPAPIRPDPPGTSPAFLDGMKIASAELEMASGQQSPQQNNPAIERTPHAIQARERMTETATYNYADELAAAIRRTGEIIVDLAPHVYDTERVIKILGKDGTQTEAVISPDAQQAYQEEKKSQDEIKVLFNPRIGRYSVEADVGPAYQTQRQEAFNAFVTITSADTELINDIGDLMFQSADFPLADKIAERLKRKIKKERPWLLDDNAPSPEQQQQAQQIQQLTQQVAELLQRLATKELQLKGKDQRRDIEAYKAESDRAAKEANMVTDLIALEDPQLKSALKKMILEVFSQMSETNDVSQEVNASQATEGDHTAPPGGMNGAAPQ